MKNRLQNQSKVHYIDSTPLSICYYRNSYRCKVQQQGKIRNALYQFDFCLCSSTFFLTKKLDIEII